MQGFIIPSELDGLRKVIVDLAMMCVEDHRIHPLTYDLFYSNCEIFGTILIALAILKRDENSELESMNLSGTVSVMTATIAPSNKKKER